MHALIKLITGTFCSRILGFLRDIVFFAILGSSMEASAFLIAFAIPNLFRRLCGEGALSSAFIPVFAQRYVQRPQTTTNFLNAFFTRFGVYLGIVIFLVMFILAFLHQWITDPKWATVLYLTNAMLPYLWFICTAALLNGALNVLNAFSLTAFSPVLLNLTMLTGLWYCSSYVQPMMQVRILSVCVILGGLLQWFLPKRQLKSHGFPLNTFIWKKDSDLERIWNLFLPSVLGAAIFQINTMLGRFFAYIMDERAVSFLYLANRFLELPLGLFAFAIISVVLPKLSLHSAQQDEISSKNTLASGLQLIMLLLIPCAIGLYLLSQPILDLCFRWGKFSEEDILNVIPLLKIFAVGLPLFGITALLTRVFYAHKDTKTPVKLSGITLILYILSFLIFMPLMGVNSLALASVLSTFVLCYLQIKIIQKRYAFYALTFKMFFEKKCLALALFAVILYFLNHMLSWNLQKMQIALQLSLLILSSGFIYLILLKIFDKKSFKILLKLRID